MSPRGKRQLQRVGNDLHVNNVPVEFSYWPAQKQKRNNTLQFELFSKSAWPVIEGSVNLRCPKPVKPAAQALLAQAEDFYQAAINSGVASKPVLFYYSFLNLVKAFILTEGRINSVEEAQHGLSEKKEPNGREVQDAFLHAFPSKKKEINIYDSFMDALGYQKLSTKSKFPIKELLAQTVAGHRLWKEATRRKERFIPVNEVRFKNNHSNLKLWVNLYILKSDLSRFKITHDELQEEANLTRFFKEVECDIRPYMIKEINKSEMLCFEQKNPLNYNMRPLDKIDSLTTNIKIHKKLWLIATSIPPYRKYYLYMKPKDEILLPQLGTIYSLFYYLSSVARYRPNVYLEEILNSRYRAYFLELLSSQPEQFLYLLASEFAHRQVVKPAII